VQTLELNPCLAHLGDAPEAVRRDPGLSYQVPGTARRS
jgi:hypothetical protein